jgi:hypothetical protein
MVISSDACASAEDGATHSVIPSNMKNCGDERALQLVDCLVRQPLTAQKRADIGRQDLAGP